jgi:hypothetical protein
MSSKGRYYAAKYKNSGAQVWNPPSSKRFSKSSKVLVMQTLKFRELGIIIP